MFGQTDSAVPRLLDLLQRGIYPHLKPMDRPTKLPRQTLLVLIDRGKFDRIEQIWVL